MEVVDLDIFKETDGILYYNRHLIGFCTYHRIPLLKGPMIADLAEILRNAAAECGAQILDMIIETDYVIVDIESDPRQSLHKIVKQLKLRSVGEMQARYPVIKSRAGALWTKRYVCMSYGKHSYSIVQEYLTQEKTRPEIEASRNSQGKVAMRLETSEDSDRRHLK